MTELPDYLNFNGKILPANKLFISPDNRSFRYGDGCFETMRVNKGNISLASFHFDRLFDSLIKLHFDIPASMTRESLTKQVIDLIAKNNHPLARIRITIFRGDGGLYDPVNHKANYLIQSWPLNPVIGQLNPNGLILDVFKDAVKTADQFSMIKSNNFLPYVMAAIYAKEMKLNDCLLLNPFGKITDSTIANIFVVIDNTIYTPPVTDGPVNGVLRRYLLESLSTSGYQVRETSITPADLRKASEIFLTNAVSGIRWVSTLPGIQYRNRLSGELHARFIAPLFFS